MPRKTDDGDGEGYDEYGASMRPRPDAAENASNSSGGPLSTTTLQ